MSFTEFRQRVWDRGTSFLGKAFIASIFLLSGGTVAMYGAVHHTAQPEFCNTCHIMEPYFKSWQNSKHKDVACIECHYEPGAVETLEGKFKALSQLAKYVTQTQGTKPWAEVSDQSCMRSGCHSVRMLDGPVQFGRISFDHRQHLLESRRGRRLRCTSCHSQIVQGEHVSVTSSVCITCHFMPGKDGTVPEKTSNCMTCHGPPTEPIPVEGRPFVHADYVDRNVGCRECHNPVVEGNGQVRKERCNSCHAETGRIERIGETEFMHEKHVTEHKVECFQCHDEIRHGLLPLKKPEATKKEGCGVCHAAAHDAASLVFAGTGAVGVEDKPSRMYQTRVVCEACHTGRSGFLSPNGELADFSHAATAAPDDSKGATKPSAIADAHSSSHAHASQVAAAGNVDCIHCHGTTYDGLAGQWQAAVGEQLDRLKPMLVELESKVPADPANPAHAAFDDAQKNLALIALDGSRGVHNPSYAIAALRVTAERIDGAREMLGIASTSKAQAELPFNSKDGCTTCHVGAGRPAAIWKGESRFPHQRHLAQRLECSTCHSTERHGEPKFPRDQCATCHHQEGGKVDVSECATCHAAQSNMLTGKIAGFDEKPGTMAKLECTDCHGEAPTIVRPKPANCVVCHKPGYDDKMGAWKTELDGLGSQLDRALAKPESKSLDAAKLERAKKALEAVRLDGSHGAHNFELSKSLLEEALKSLESP